MRPKQKAKEDICIIVSKGSKIQTKTELEIFSKLQGQ